MAVKSPLARAYRDDGAYTAFLGDLDKRALSHFRKEYPKPTRDERDRFKAAAHARIREAFPEWRYEAYVRGSTLEYEQALLLVDGMVNEILRPNGEFDMSVY